MMQKLQPHMPHFSKIFISIFIIEFVAGFWYLEMQSNEQSKYQNVQQNELCVNQYLFINYAFSIAQKSMF